MTMDVDRFVLEVVNDLVVEFDGMLSRQAVLAVVVEAREDLEGRIAQEALKDMVLRLAHHRLDELLASEDRRARVRR